MPDLCTGGGIDTGTSIALFGGHFYFKFRQSMG